MNRILEICAKCSHQAYYNHPRIADFLPADVSKYTQFNVLNNGQSVTIYETILNDYTESNSELQKKTYIVSFRGTDDHVDWATNLSLIKSEIDLPAGITDPIIKSVHSKLPWYCSFHAPRIHNGFLQAYSSLKGDIHTYFEECDRNGSLKGSNIILTGHSLGGALATICGYDLFNFQENHGASISIVTFGAPRVCNLYGSILMSEMYKGRAFRVVNGMDPVSMTPLINSWHCFSLITLYETSYWQCFKYLLWLPHTALHLTDKYIERCVGMNMSESFYRK